MCGEETLTSRREPATANMLWQHGTCMLAACGRNKHNCWWGASQTHAMGSYDRLPVAVCTKTWPAAPISPPCARAQPVHDHIPGPEHARLKARSVQCVTSCMTHRLQQPSNAGQCLRPLQGMFCWKAPLHKKRGGTPQHTTISQMQSQPVDTHLQALQGLLSHP